MANCSFRGCLGKVEWRHKIIYQNFRGYVWVGQPSLNPYKNTTKKCVPYPTNYMVNTLNLGFTTKTYTSYTFLLLKIEAES